MSTGLAAFYFAVSLIATLYAASVFANRLDHFGDRLGLPEAILGLLTALAADAPELSSAIFALARGRHDVGLGVVVGSNVFNLAAMLGIPALVAAPIVIRRETLVLEGTLALGAAGAVALFAFGVIPAWAVVTATAALFALYVLLIVLAEEGGVPRRPRHRLRRALGERHRKAPTREPVSAAGVALMIGAAVAIVLGSMGMVHSALTLGGAAHIPDILVGTLLLAVLTSLPNAYTGVRLGLARRGAALVSEAMNSNTINLIGGAAIPALFVTFDSSGLEKADLVLLFALTAVTIVLLAARTGMRRAGGVVLIAVWVAFVATQVLVR